MLLAPLTAACLATAAHAYQLPPIALYAILKTEGGHVGQIVHNRNGTDDLGPFQINTGWGPAIGRYWRMPVPQALERVKDDGCANAIIASAILRKFLNESRGDLPKAIGFYHSHSEGLAASYRIMVFLTAAEFAADSRDSRRPGQ
jgi:hypothetical protein